MPQDMTIVPLDADPNVKIIEIAAVDHGNSYSHHVSLKQLQTVLPLSERISYDSNRDYAVFGLRQANEPIALLVSRGIYRLIVISPDGLVSVLEDTDTNPRGGLRPTRGVIVPAGYIWAIQSTLKTCSFDLYCSTPAIMGEPMHPVPQVIIDWAEDNRSLVRRSYEDDPRFVR